MKRTLSNLLLIVVVLGMLVFGESLTWRVGAGGTLILLSIVAVTWLQKPEPGPPQG